MWLSRWVGSTHLLPSFLCILGSFIMVAGVQSSSPSSSSSSSSSLFEESLALLSLKAGFVDEYGGAPEHLHDWNITTTRTTTNSTANTAQPCNWMGVKCNNVSTHVIGLDISSMNLSGTLSEPAIAILSHLTYLNISNNLLGGHFPKNLSSLAPTLEVLDAFNNNFTGELPVEVSVLTSLKHLHLGGNYFSGGIPPQYGNLVNLQYLALSGNALTGRIPPQLGSLMNLQRLYLGYYNEFEGGIPVELGRLSNLVRLDLANSGLSGEIPSSLGSLSSLDSLFLQTNSLMGPIPHELGNLTNLKSLDLSNNKLSGSIPKELASLHKLELLNLFLNNLHGRVPSYIGDLPNLQVLTLWENNFTGPIPHHLGRNGQLLELDLSSNSFYGFIPPHLCKSKKLTRLILLRNRISGPIPSGIANCPKLVRVRMGDNMLSGSIPPGILSLPELDLLELPRNRLNGDFPEINLTTPSSSSKLGSLDLSHNELTGTLPSSIGSLSGLVDLDLSGNRITGSMPEEIGSLKRLAKLDLSGNLMNGSLPLTITHCSSLASIDLSHNRFRGEIPPELSNLNVLASFNVSYNNFYGSIPLSLENMSTLTTVDFSFNNFSGLVPDQGQFANFNETSFVGNPQLCSKNDCIAEVRKGVNTNTNTTGWKLSSSSRSLIYGMSGLVVGLFILTLGALVFMFRNERDKQFLCSLFNESFLSKRSWKLTAFERLDFTANDVLECLTNENVIGKGGSGTVYKGLMPNGKMVAIKKLPAIRKGSPEEDSEEYNDHGFAAEILTLGNIRHRHIVRLVGCCSNHEANLLLYEHMPNGSLGELLHGPRGGSLSWGSRYKIALQAAMGLCYLHHDCTPLIVHRDVKSNNILLDSNYEAHVADFGLARTLRDSMGKSESMSSVAGSYGYIAPEYAYTLKINEKSDIYSFGVVLLELVTGRRPIEPEYGDCIDIARWVRKHVVTNNREGILEVVDARMSLDVDGTKEAMLLLKVALSCLSDIPDHRPTMREVVQLLSEINGIVKDPPRTTSPPDLILI